MTTPTITRVSAVAIACAITLLGELPVAFAQAPPPPPADAAGQPGQGQGQGQRSGRGQGQQDGGPGDERRQRGGFGGGMGGGFGGLQRQFLKRMEPDFMKRDVPIIKEQLTLDDGQATVVETLIVDYVDGFEPVAEETRTKVQEAVGAIAQSFMGGGMQERMREAFDSVRSDMEQLQQENGGAEVDPEVRRKLFQERIDKLQQEVEAERATTGQADEQRRLIQEIVDASNAFLTKKVALRKETAEAIKAVLRADQAAKWDSFERFLRRERAMGNGVLSGEGTNLIFVLDDAGLTQAGIDASKSVLDNYELQLDAALKSRDEFLESSEPRLLKAALDQNTTEADRIVGNQLSLRKGVRDINERFRVELTQALPAEDGEKFSLAALKESFRRTYATTDTQRRFEEALKLEGLSAEVMEAIVSLQSQYVRELMAINDRIVTATKTQEVDRTKEDMNRGLQMLNGTGSWSNMMGRRGGRGGNDGQPDPVRDAFDSRAELAETYTDRLKALLTPEQFELLPKGGNERRGPGGPGGGPGGGGFGSGLISEMPEQFRERAKQYDTNSDGTLDEAERTKMFEEFRGRFQGGQGGGAGGQGGPGRGGRQQGDNGA